MPAVGKSSAQLRLTLDIRHHQTGPKLEGQEDPREDVSFWIRPSRSTDVPIQGRLPHFSCASTPVAVQAVVADRTYLALTCGESSSSLFYEG